MTWLLAIWAGLTPVMKKVVIGAALVVVLLLLVVLYGWRKEQQGRHEATILVQDHQAAVALATTKTQFHEESTHVAAVKKARGVPRVVKVVRPGVVQIRDTLRDVPVEVTTQLTADSTRLAQDTLVFDTLLIGWHGAIGVADSTRLVANQWRGQATDSHWKRNVGIGAAVIVTLATIIHFSHH